MGGLGASGDRDGDNQIRSRWGPGDSIGRPGCNWVNIHNLLNKNLLESIKVILVSTPSNLGYSLNWPSLLAR